MEYPKSIDKKINKLSKILVSFAEKEGFEFCIRGKELYPVEAFSFFGGLPLLLVEAKEVYEKVFNGLYTAEELLSAIGQKMKEPPMEEALKEQELLSGMKKDKVFPVELYAKEEDTFFGFIPLTTEDCDFFMLAHFSQYTLDEYIKIYKRNKLMLVDGRIPLDPLYDKLVAKVNGNEVRLLPEHLTPKAKKG